MRSIRSPLDGIRSPFGRTPGGGVVPVLSAFGAGSIDDLELDPPALFIEHNTSGTLTGDFDVSATPPAKEGGSIGFFTTSLSGDAVTDISTALNTFLDANPGETGYLHFRLTNGAGDSNVITTQVITTASGVTWATVTGTTGSPTIHSDVDGDGLWDAYEFTANGSITLTGGSIGRRLWQGGGGSGGAVNDSRLNPGGGGGGWTEQDNTEPDILADTYTVTIGAGGAGVSPNTNGNPGGDTTAFSITASGGGFGGGGTSSRNGGAGGNGGGAMTGPSAGTAATGGTGSQGFSAGSIDSTLRRAGTGGAGSGGASPTATVADVGTVGGAGIDSDILGTTVNFGAGGGAGGSATSPVVAAGGASGTASSGTTSASATANRGGGSGGGLTGSGNGGSGCFIIRIRRA